MSGGVEPWGAGQGPPGAGWGGGWGGGGGVAAPGGRGGGGVVFGGLGVHNKNPPLEAHLGSAASVEAVKAAVVFGVAEQWLDRLFAFAVALLAVFCRQQ